MSAEARPAGVPNNRAARTVYVMRSTGAGSEPDGGSSGSPLNTDSGTHKRKVLLARKLPAGGTIHLTETPVSVTAPDGYDEELKTVPQSMMSPARMPRANVATGEQKGFAVAARADVPPVRRQAGAGRRACSLTYFHRGSASGQGLCVITVPRKFLGQH